MTFSSYLAVKTDGYNHYKSTDLSRKPPNALEWTDMITEYYDKAITDAMIFIRMTSTGLSFVIMTFSFTVSTCALFKHLATCKQNLRHRPVIRGEIIRLFPNRYKLIHGLKS